VKTASPSVAACSNNAKQERDLPNSFGAALATSPEATTHIMFSFLCRADEKYGAEGAKFAGGCLERVKLLAARLQD
jgi:hypothetical protein